MDKEILSGKSSSYFRVLPERNELDFIASFLTPGSLSFSSLVNSSDKGSAMLALSALNEIAPGLNIPIFRTPAAAAYSYHWMGAFSSILEHHQGTIIIYQAG